METPLEYGGALPHGVESTSALDSERREGRGIGELDVRRVGPLR